MTEEFTCDDCGEVVEFQRNEIRALNVSCGCTSRAVKVAAKLPEGWSA
jgi:Fe2+ or Zn2+ uptake regulation protein